MYHKQNMCCDGVGFHSVNDEAYGTAGEINMNVFAELSSFVDCMHGFHKDFLWIFGQTRNKMK